MSDLLRYLFSTHFLVDFCCVFLLGIFKVHRCLAVNSSRMAAFWALALSCAWVEHTWVAMENQTLPMRIVRCAVWSINSHYFHIGDKLINPSPDRGV